MDEVEHAEADPCPAVGMGCAFAADWSLASHAGYCRPLGLGQPDGISGLTCWRDRHTVRLKSRPGAGVSPLHADSDDRPPDIRFREAHLVSAVVGEPPGGD